MSSTTQDADSLGIDWCHTMTYRPVFPVDYWPGTPAITKEGRPDFRSDLRHITSYADPVVWRSLSFMAGTDVGPDVRRLRGWLTVPDVLGMSDAALARWQRETQRALEPILSQFRREGVRIQAALSLMMSSGGMDYSPEWYRSAVPDWEECDYSGTPLSQLPKGGWGKNLACTLPCLFHPELYRMIDRVCRALSFLRDEPCFAGVHIDNELNLGDHRPLERVGGNPHTRAAFREFLKGTYPSVRRLNQVAGTSYRALEEVEISDGNWLIQVMAGRFRATWIEGVYLPRCAALIKKHLPDAVTISRCQAGLTFQEYGDGREVFDEDMTHAKGSALDVLAYNLLWQPTSKGPRRFNAPVASGFGAFNVTGSLLRGTGKMLGIPEFHAQRHVRYQWCVPRPEELLNYMYRGLHFNFRMLMLHSWDRESSLAASGVIYNEPFGAVYSKHPGTLRMVAQLRSEFDRSRPFETFGKPVLPPMGILVSRNARHFPGLGGWAYGNLLCRLSDALEHPRSGHYEIVEEQTRDVARELKAFKGLVVVDACLSARTRRAVARFVQRGGRLLVMGAPATVDASYSPCEPGDVYPAQVAVPGVAAAVRRKTRKPTSCRLTRSHPVFKGLRALKLQAPAPVKTRKGASVLARNAAGDVLVAADARGVYISGVVADSRQLRLLLANFQEWCGVRTSRVFVSRFANATVVQNWDTANHRPDGSVIDETPWTGTVAQEGRHGGAVRELRQDHVWLAYHREGGRTVLESVKVAPQDVKVFRREAAQELCHVEGFPDSLGFSYWWDGGMHPIIGRFTASQPTQVQARIVDGAVKTPIRSWFVCEVGGRRIAEGKGRRVRFSVKPGREYYFAVVSKDSAHDAWAKSCALCVAHAFE